LIKSREIELIQYLRPLSLGPSGKTWPKCESHLLHLTSVLVMKCELSVKDFIDSLSYGSVKLGHPE
jgi:hypothetical protein